MHIYHPGNSPGTGTDPAQGLGWRSGVREFTEAVSDDVKTDLYDKEGYQERGECVHYMPGRLDEGSQYTQENSYRREGIGAVMPRIGHDQFTLDAPADADDIVIQGLLKKDRRTGTEQGQFRGMVFDMMIDIQGGFYPEI